MSPSRPRSGAEHELVDHTSEVTLRLRAPTFFALLAEATRAFAELVPASIRTSMTDEPREFRIIRTDPVAELVEWLNELVYLCEAEQWLPVEVDVTADGESTLRIRAEGVALTGPFVLVKAATLHRATVQEGPRGLEAEVTLDV